MKKQLGSLVAGISLIAVAALIGCNGNDQEVAAKPKSAPQPLVTESKGHRDEVLGSVIAIRRTFKLDLSDCQDQYQVKDTFAMCEVKNGTELNSNEFDPKDDLELVSSKAAVAANGKQVKVSLYLDSDSYSLEITSASSDDELMAEDLAFENVEDLLGEAIEDVPNKELSVVFYRAPK